MFDFSLHYIVMTKLFFAAMVLQFPTRPVFQSILRNLPKSNLNMSGLILLSPSVFIYIKEILHGLLKCQS